MALGLLVTGCSLLEPDSEASGPPSSSGSASGVSKELTRFYDQTLDWQGCRTVLGECAELEVPLDWSEPEGATIQIGVYRAQAPGESRGSLVVNPGGPGGSGMDYAMAARVIVGDEILRTFDIVGFDPRGVGQSEAIDCLNGPELDEYFGRDLTPDSAAEREAVVESSKDFAQKCREREGEILEHISTVDVAKDMDVLRAALGDAKLNYLGKSYGTYLGTIYAELFPEHVGRMVLDGAVAPDLTALEFVKGQAKGFERAGKSWAQHCVDQGCLLGSSVEEVIQSVEGLLKDLDQNPIPGSGGLQLTEGWATLGIVRAMYDESWWPRLTDALVDAEQGDGSALAVLGMRYAGRTPSGQYPTNLEEAGWAITCTDRAPTTKATDWTSFEKKVSEVAPIMGDAAAWRSVTCAVWPVEPQIAPHKVSAKGAGPILVIGTTGDPATPYAWAKRLYQQLDNAALITYEGDGHTAYMRSNDCVDSAVDEFWMTGKVPEGGELTC